MDHLPTLFAKNQSDVNRMVEILRLTSGMHFDLYFELRMTNVSSLPFMPNLAVNIQTEIFRLQQIGLCDALGRDQQTVYQAE